MGEHVISETDDRFAGVARGYDDGGGGGDNSVAAMAVTATTAMATAAGCKTSLAKDNQHATSSRSADFEASEAPMANSAPGVAAPPKIVTNSLTGTGIGVPVAETMKPAPIDIERKSGG